MDFHHFTYSLQTLSFLTVTVYSVLYHPPTRINARLTWFTSFFFLLTLNYFAVSVIIFLFEHKVRVKLMGIHIQ